MKGILCACLLALLQSTSPAQAYEADIHYSTTYVLARAVGWSEADALTIASANQGVDENQDTVAALEVDTTPGPVPCRLRHELTAPGGEEPALSLLQQNPWTGRPDLRRRARGRIRPLCRSCRHHDEDPRRNARRLIALGVALHCQQDAYSHAGFGGSCGAYPGSCYGHTHQTFFDQVVVPLAGEAPSSTRIIQVFRVSDFWRRSGYGQRIGSTSATDRFAFGPDAMNWSLCPTLCVDPDSNYLTKCGATAIVTLPASGSSTSSTPAAGRKTARTHGKNLRQKSPALAGMRRLPRQPSSGSLIRVSHA